MWISTISNHGVAPEDEQACDPLPSNDPSIARRLYARDVPDRSRSGRPAKRLQGLRNQAA
jgi:hypothetical protein